TIVNHDHVLHMPEYDAELQAVEVRPTHVYGQYVDADRYPGGRGLLVSARVAITNRQGDALTFDAAAQDVQLFLPPGHATSCDVMVITELLTPRGAPSPILGRLGPIAPGQAATGWVTFVTPIWTRRVLHQPPAELVF